MRKVPARRADAIKEVGKLDRISYELAVKVPWVPVQKDATDVEYYSFDVGMWHAANVTPALAGDGNCHHRIARRSVWLRRLDQRRLGIAGRVGGPRLDPVGARRGVPVNRPLPPGVDPGDRSQLGLTPRTAIHAHLDGIDALVLSPGHARDRGPSRLHRPLP